MSALNIFAASFDSGELRVDAAPSWAPAECAGEDLRRPRGIKRQRSSRRGPR